MMRRTIAAVLSLSIMFIALDPVPAYPHGGGLLRLVSKQVPSGGTISMIGAKFGKTENLRVELRGVLDNYPAGNIRTDTAGRFTADITIPTAVLPGVYTIVLVANDGDIAARSEVTVGPAAAAGAAAQGMPHMAGATMEDMPGMEGTSEMMKIDLATTTPEWIVIAALVLASFAGGAALVARSRRLTGY